MTRTLSVAAALAITGAAHASWPFLPGVNLPIADQTGDQAVVKIASASDGGCWIAWFDNNGGGYKVRAQKLDYNGNEVFPHNGILVSANPQSSSLVDWDLNSDGAGGCVLAFTDTRDGGDLDVFAYRLAPDGAQMWGANGVQISANTNFDADPRIIRLSTGDFVCAYQRTNGGSATPAIVMQRLDSAGNKQLGPDGVVIAGDGVEGPGFLEMVPSDSGSFIMIYIRDTRTFQSPRHVRAQRFDASGSPMWNGGSPILLSGTTSVPIAHKPRIVSDGAGGAVFAWHTTALQSFGQHLDNNGNAFWLGASGAQFAVDGTNLSMDPALAYSPPTGQTTVLLRFTNSGQTASGLKAQIFNANGIPALGPAGLPLVALNSGAVAAPRAAWLGGADALGIYSTTPLGSTDTTIFATRLDGAGAQVWAGATVALSPTTGSRFRIGLAMAANGEGRVAWEGDTRNIVTTPDIFASNIHPTGGRGSCPGDGNFDLTTNFADLNNILSQFGTSGLFLTGDVNGDGLVNFADLNITLSAFGAICLFP